MHLFGQPLSDGLDIGELLSQCLAALAGDGHIALQALRFGPTLATGSADCGHHVVRLQQVAELVEAEFEGLELLDDFQAGDVVIGVQAEAVLGAPRRGTRATSS